MYISSGLIRLHEEVNARGIALGHSFANGEQETQVEFIHKVMASKDQHHRIEIIRLHINDENKVLRYRNACTRTLHPIMIDLIVSEEET